MYCGNICHYAHSEVLSHATRFDDYVLCFRHDVTRFSSYVLFPSAMC